MISNKYQCIFIHIPRTGGTSIENVLRDRLIPVAWGSSHEKIKKYKNFAQFNNYFKFAIVRNPFDRLVSIFTYQSKGGNGGAKDIARSKKIGTDFKKFCFDFMPNSGFNSQQFDYLNIHDKVAVDFVGRFEKLNDDFKKIANRLRLKYPLPHVRKSKHKPYRDYYDKETKQFIGNFFKKDLKYFKYKF